jgi:hypothetical protein
MKTCQVFFKGTVAFVFTQSVTRSGIGITTDPMFKVPADSFTDLAQAVFACLAASTTGVPDPTDYAAVAKQMIRFAKERSWTRFASGAKLRGVWLLDAKLKVVPFDAAAGASFEQREDLSFECPLDPLSEVGRRLHESTL